MGLNLKETALLSHRVAEYDSQFYSMCTWRKYYVWTLLVELISARIMNPFIQYDCNCPSARTLPCNKISFVNDYRRVWIFYEAFTSVNFNLTRLVTQVNYVRSQR